MKTHPLFLLPLLLLVGCETKDRFVGAPVANPYPRHGQITTNSAVIAWQTDAPASSEVQFGPNTSYSSSAGNPNERVTLHKVALSGLSPASLVHYRVKSLSGSGDMLFSYDRSFRTFSGASPITFNDNFESATFLWVPQTYIDSQGVLAVSRSGAADHTTGTGFSQRMDVEIHGQTHPTLGKGESLLEIDALSGVNGVDQGFLDLTGKSLSAWFITNAGISTVNGFAQVFVKDANGGACYGPGLSIGTAWTQVTMALASCPSGSPYFMTPGFDPSLITTVGVKVGGGGVNPALSYIGPVFVDDVLVTP